MLIAVKPRTLDSHEPGSTLLHKAPSSPFIRPLHNPKTIPSSGVLTIGHMVFLRDSLWGSWCSCLPGRNIPVVAENLRI